jgi:hypothetical protein
METAEITLRTKNAIRDWVQNPNRQVLLDDKLSKFQENELSALRVRVNGRFEGENGFPIRTPDWNALKLKTVRDVRDAAKARLES